MPGEVTTDMPDRTLSDEERRLLDAVAADPESLTARLAYADFIESAEPERAEFIRLSIAIDPHRSDLAYDDPRAVRYRKLEARVSRPLADGGTGGGNFERGFLRYSSLRSDEPFERAAALFELNPLLRDLTLFVEPDSADSLASLPHLSRLRELTVLRFRDTPAVDDGRLAALLASPHLTSLKSLAFEDAGVGPLTARAIGASPALRSLERLSVYDDRAFDSRAAAALAEGGRLEHLWRLNISRCEVRSDGCAALADSPLLAGLRWLKFDGTRIDDEGAAALARAALGACVTLSAQNAAIGDAGAIALARSAAFESLEELDLSNNYVADAGAQAFAAASHFPKLRRLLLQHNAIGESGAEALAGTDRLPSLEALGLGQNAIYTGEYTEVVDYYDGGPVGGHPIPMDVAGLQQRYGRRFTIE